MSTSQYQLVKLSAITAIQADLEAAVEADRIAAQAAQAAAETAQGIAEGAQAAAESAEATALVYRDEAIEAFLPSSGPLHYAIDLGTQGVRMAIDLRTDVHALQADVVTAQDTADAAVSDAATAQSTANTAVSDAAGAQSTADGAVTDAAAAQLAADEAQSDATLALLQTVALHYATDVATVSSR